MTRRLSRHALKIRNRGLILELLERRDVPSFLGASSYPAGALPWALATGHFNSDGTLDAVVANYGGSGGVSVLLGVGDGTLQPAGHYTTGAQTRSVTAADISGDGILDLVASNSIYPAGTISVLIGRGDGTFKPAVNYAAGETPYGTAVADFNSDTIADLAVANDASPGKVKVFLGVGDDTFTTSVDYATGSFPYALLTRDFDADGDFDLVTANLYANTVSVLLGNGNGSFQSPLTFAAGQRPISLAAADFDSDGDLDLAAANYVNAGTVSILLGNGNGSFAAPVAYDSGFKPASVTTGDFDNDGKSDLAFANFNTITVLLGRGNGSFKPKTSYLAGNGAHAISVGDVNNDGKQDLISADSGGAVTIVLGLGDGRFAAATQYVTKPPTALLTQDFTGAGVLDVAMAHAPFWLSLTKGKSDGTFQPGVPFSNELEFNDLAAADFDADGRLDLAATTTEGGGLVAVLSNTGAGSGFAPTQFPTGANVGGLAIGDLNADAVPDVVATTQFGVAVLFGTGGGNYQPPAIYAAGGSSQAVDLADFNLDGRLDVVTENALLLGNGDGTFQVLTPSFGGYSDVEAGDFNEDAIPDAVTLGSSGSTAHISLGNGDGTFQPAVSFATDYGPRFLDTGDLNGDGFLDVATANYNSPNHTVTVLVGNGNGTFKPPVNYQASPNQNPHGVRVVDVNADGREDLVVLIYTSAGSIAVLLGNGDGTFQSPLSFAAGASPLDLDVGDLNGDGIVDVLVANSAINNGAKTAGILFGIGDGTFKPVEHHSGFPAPTTAAISDLNGDSINDIVIGNDGAATISVVLGEPGGKFPGFATHSTGNDPFALAAEDFNADGYPDLAVTTYTDPGTVRVLLNNGDGTFTPKITYLVGAYPSDIVVADYNADGRLDLAVLNSGSGTLTIWRGNGNGGFRRALTFAAGAAPTTFVTADFNGDGKLDFAVGDALVGDVNIIIGNGNGTFQPPVSYDAGSVPGRLVAADFNNDGRMDVAFSNVVTIMLGNGDGSLQTPVSYVVGLLPAHVAAGDFNGDGFVDLLAGNENGFAVLFNAADWPPLPIGDGPRPYPPLDVFPTTDKPRPTTTPRAARIALAMEPANVEGTKATGPQHVSRAIARLAAPATTEGEFDLFSKELV